MTTYEVTVQIGPSLYEVRTVRADSQKQAWGLGRGTRGVVVAIVACS